MMMMMMMVGGGGDHFWISKGMCALQNWILYYEICEGEGS